MKAMNEKEVTNVGTLNNYCLAMDELVALDKRSVGLKAI